MDNSIQAHQKELCNKLWAMANALRGNMEAYEFKNYILGMIFYYYLSDKTEKYMVNLLKDDNISYEDAWNDEEYKAAIVEEALRDLGYIIEPEYLFRKMVKMVENRSFDIEFLQKAINALMESTIGNDSQEDFDGLFSDMQLDSTKLGHTVKDRSAVMAKIIASLDEINFSVDDTKIDVLGNAYEYLIGQFAATAGKKAGEFYTPSGPAELLCRLACLGLTDVKDAADPTCGSGSLLLRLKNYANVRNYYGQELTSTTYNLARMNMILRGIPYRNFNIYNGDTLEHDYFGDMKFRVQVANPPYSANWSADMHFMEDERFNEYGKLAPKSKADFAFVQHMVYHMDEDGRAVVLLPHGVLFRGAAEEVIRKHLIQKLNVLDAVIGLPANLFFGTGIPVCVLVLKRERNGNSDNILFIDASNDFEAGKNQNMLALGIGNVVLVDKNGALCPGEDWMNPAQAAMAEVTNKDKQTGALAEIMKGKDVFIGVSAPNIVTAEMVASMANDPIVFAMANPTPEIMPEEAKKGGVRVMATGRSDYPNQINNVLVFPGIFRGALDAKAKAITEEMKIAAAKAIASIVTDEELNEEYIIPGAFDERVAKVVAKAVSDEAKKLGIVKE